MAKKETPQTKIQLVRGFVEGVDQISTGLELPAPFSRFAVVTETYNPDTESGFEIDAGLIVGYLRALCKDFDCKLNYSRDGENLTIMDLEASGLLEVISEDFFQKINVREKGDLVMQIFGLPYYRAGGLEPYHDSATIEIYCTKDLSGEIKKRIKQASKDMEVEVETISGDAHPIEKTWIQTFLRWLGE